MLDFQDSGLRFREEGLLGFLNLGWLSDLCLGSVEQEVDLVGIEEFFASPGQFALGEVL